MNNMMFHCIMPRIIWNASFELDNHGTGNDILKHGEKGAWN